MSMYKLILNIETSIPSGAGKTFVLKSNMLKYDPSEISFDLSEYPFFSPNASYNNAYSTIERMSYSEKIEVFFNESRFKYIILGQKETNKSKNDKPTDNMIHNKSNNNTSSLAKANYDMFITWMFPTSYPVSDNYVDSLSYFSSVLKPQLNIFNLFQNMFSAQFSHLNIGNEIYTIIGVTAKNDVFNHPVYNKLIQEYKDVGNINQEQLDKEDIPKKKGEIISNYFKKDEKKQSKITTCFKELVSDISKHSNNQNITDIVNEEKRQAVYNILKTLKVESEKEEIEEKAIFEALLSLYEDLDNFKSNYGLKPDSKQRLIHIANLYGQLYIKEKAIEHISRKNFDFSKETKHDREKIISAIEKFSPAFVRFLKTIEDFKENRYIQNQAWNAIVGGIDKGDSTNATNQLDMLVTCFKYPDSCFEAKNNNLLEVGLDRIRQNKEGTFDNVEAYLHMNVVQGELNSGNLSKAKCAYLDKSIGTKISNLIISKSGWDVSKKGVFFSIKDELESIQQKRNKKIEDKKNTKQKEKPKQKQNMKQKEKQKQNTKKGGRKKKKRWTRKRFSKTYLK